MIRLDVADAVATITLARPERLNAAPPAMFDEIAAALKSLPEAGARAVLITGEGRAFCSGADLAAKAGASVADGEGAYQALTRSYNPAMLLLSQLPIPIVTAVNGAAAGIGCSLALAGDFVFAGQSAYFLQAFVNIGLVPDGGASWTLPRLIGKARATEMMLLGERISAEKAADWGLIHKAVSDETLIAEATALARRLAQGPTLALGLARRAIAAGQELDYAAALAGEAANQREAGGSADAAEGIRAFLEKRAPSFTGK
ncbi:MAG: enoyl-CoA hydratase-related protein [Sphingobium sp.]